jgi:putative heme-binding domain-containing protein
MLPLIEKATTQEERLHYLFTLRHVKTGWTLEQRRAWIAAFRREAARAVGAHHMGVTFRYCRAEFEAALTQEEKTALAADLATLDPSATAIPAAEPRPFFKAWTMAELEPHLAAVAAPERDLKRGRALFDSQCAACHRYGPRGGVIGPDLTGLAGRFDRRTVLESLLDPWKVVAEPYRMATATLKSGEIVSGPVLGDDGDELSINVNPVDADRARKVRRGDTSALAITSLMAPGLANTFTKEELLDLMAFMERGELPN